MSKLVSLKTQNGKQLLIEVDEKYPDIMATQAGKFQEISRRENVAVAATDEFKKAVEGIQPAVEGIVEVLKSASPGKIEIEFGLKCSIGANFFVSAGSEANFIVRMSWEDNAPKVQGEKKNTP